MGTTSFMTSITTKTTVDDANTDSPILNEKYVIAGSVFLVFVICVVVFCYIYANKSDHEEIEKMM